MNPLLSKKATALRLKSVLPYLRGRILDVGCGWTRLPKVLAPGQMYVGVDGNEQALEYDRRTYPQHRFYRRDFDREPLNLGEERFDTAVMTAVIEHLREPQHILTEIRSVLAPEGVLLVTTPTPLGDWLHRLGDPLNLFYSEKTVAHIKIYNQAALRKIALECGYEPGHYHTFAWGANQLLICRLLVNA